MKITNKCGMAFLGFTIASLAGCASSPFTFNHEPSAQPNKAPAPVTASKDVVPVQPLAAEPVTNPAEPVVVAMTPAPSTPNVTRATFASEGADFDPCVSRDGQWLVYSSTQHRPTSDIYIKRSDSRVVTQLTNDPSDDAMPSLSPDGTRIAFASNRGGNWDIYVMPITGGKAMQVTSDGADELHPSWSPDGKNLVYSKLSAMSGRWEMWVSDAANPGVSHFIGYGLFPQWCPTAGTGAEGKDTILFQLGRERGSRSFSIWTVDYANGQASNATEIASEPGMALINPAWSPDGNWISFSEVPVGAANSPRNGELPREASLWIINIDGTGKVRLTSGTGASISPAWATNNRLYFVSDRGGSQNIWSLDLGPALLAAGSTGGATAPMAEAGNGN